MSYTRFAVYYIPPEGGLAEFGAAWLGWDVARGRNVDHLPLPGLRDITKTPRKYGFHGTLKPPFRLAEGRNLDDLEAAMADLALSLAPATSEGLNLTVLGRFLALTPRSDTSTLQRVAATCVRNLDGFRAPASDTELVRRRKAGLTSRQEALLSQWGYPYVMEEFRFHLTLTGQLASNEVQVWRSTTERHLPDLPAPFTVDEIALCGEREDGYFELIHRYALAG